MGIRKNKWLEQIHLSTLPKQYVINLVIKS